MSARVEHDHRHCCVGDRGVPVAAAAAARPATRSPQSYYLALGDSVAYGAQPAKLAAGLPPSGFNTGYVDAFAARLRAVAPRIQVVNYSCPGESTRTFVEGGCSGRGDVKGLHDPFESTQLAAALAFLRAHLRPGEPDHVDALGERRRRAGRGVQGRFRLHRGSRSRAFARQVPAWRRSSSGCGRRRPVPRSSSPGRGISMSTRFRKRLRCSTRSTRRSREGRPQARRTSQSCSPSSTRRGTPPASEARVCTLTYICRKDDIHPTDAGYRAIAAAVWTASGFGRPA